jgi:hypothetical protein
VQHQLSVGRLFVRQVRWSWILHLQNVRHSDASWLKITSATYAGTAGSVSFTSDANPTYGNENWRDQGWRSSLSRHARSLDVHLYASELGAAFPWSGGDGNIPIAFAPAGCGAPAVLVNSPPGMLTLTGVTSGSGVYTQQYNVGIYDSFINYVRTAQIVMKGQVYTVKQSSR